LKQKLVNGKAYCVKFHISINNNSTLGIDGFGAYFGDNSLDTITYAHVPLTYLTPQVKNPQGNIITDTLNWTAFTGTFNANGTEEYILIGNFLSNAATQTVAILPSYTFVAGTDICLDDVSCIPIDLPAFAGNDTTCIPGTTIYLGRPRDIGIDEACKWYKLPIVITPTTPALDTAAGIFVSPVTTSTYVVVQEICGIIKYDTVIVYQDAVGIEKLKYLEHSLKVMPVPAQDLIEITIENKALLNNFNNILIYNQLGQLVREEDVNVENEKLEINTVDLKNGVYSVCLKSNKGETVSTRFIIAR